MLETEMKRFEDLEFQQLEKESSQAEEKETQIQQLLREIAEYQHSLVTRKVCVCVYGRLSEDLFIYFCTVVCVHEQNKLCRNPKT